MNFELRKIDVLSAIKVSFFIHLVIGILLGIMIGSLFAFIMSFISQFMPSEELSGFNFGAFGVFSAFLLVIFYAVFLSAFNGIIITGIFCLLYNLMASWLGGIKVEFKEGPAQVEATATFASGSASGGATANA